MDVCGKRKGAWCTQKKKSGGEVGGLNPSCEQFYTMYGARRLEGRSTETLRKLEVGNQLR